MQEQATEMIKELEQFLCEEKKAFGASSLEKSQLKRDMMEAYKIVPDMENVDRENLFSFSQTLELLRGQSVK